MRIPILIATFAFALTACGQQPGHSITTTIDGNMATTTSSTTTTGMPNAESLGIQPGKWETTIAIVDLKMSGMPGGTIPPRPAPTTVTTCVTPEQAAKGPGEFLKKAGAKCTATGANYGGGRIDVAMTCELPMGTLTSKSIGSYTPTSMTSDAEASLTGRMTMTEKIHTEARRIGDCG